MEGDLQRTVGRNLRAFRQSRGYSQEAFASEIDYHRTYMGGLERGERNLTLKSLERIASKIGVDPRDLMYGDFDPDSGRRVDDVSGGRWSDARRPDVTGR